MEFQQIVLNIALQIPGLLFGVVLHEAAHAWMADRFGDPTGRELGRMTLNPAVHIDPLGTIIFPLIGAIFGGIMFGWARPVPVNSRYFKNIRKAVFWVSFAGPLSNILFAFFASFFLGIWITKVPQDFYFYEQFAQVVKQAVVINMVLGVFNLIPFPPLDGSKMVSSFLSYNALQKYEQLANYTFLFFIVLMFSGALGYIIAPALGAANMVMQLSLRFWSGF
jgi:Zn-dependent protease